MADLNSQVINEKVSSTGSIDISPLNSDIKEIFQPYALDQFNNYTRSYADNAFYLFAPASARTYLWFVERRNLWWYRGFYPGLHNQGVLSSKIATRVVKRISELTMDGGFRVEGFNSAKTFLEKYIKDHKVKAKLKKALPMLNATGRCLGRLSFKANGSLGINFIDGNKYFAEVDEDLKVQKYIALIESFPVAISDSLNNSNSLCSEDYFYLVEQRVLDGNQAYQRFSCFKAPGEMMSAEFIGQTEFDDEKNLPPHAQRKIRQKLGSKYVLGSVYKLPFEGHIGAEVILNSDTSTDISIPGYSDSSIADAHTAFAEYDLTITQKEGNKYFAQTAVLIPDTMIPPEVVNHPSGNVQHNWLKGQQSLDGRVYKSIPFLDSKHEQKPIFFQADNQSDTYNQDLQRILSNIATLCGLTPTSLAGDLSSNGDRTATEVLNEDAITRTTIQCKRDRISDGLYELFRMILEYYEINDNGSTEAIDIIFNNSIMNNPKAETEDILSQVQGGIMSKRRAIGLKNKNFSDEEIDEELKAIEADESARVANQWTGF